MGETTGIEWCSHTFNMWRGCTKVSDGCKFCYAETLSARNHATLGTWGPKGERTIAAESYWKQPVKWNKEAQAAGERRRVFCASLADVFEGVLTMPKDSWKPVRDAQFRLFELIENTPNLDWLLLTKRPENIVPMSPEHWKERFPSNVWIGTSVEDQKSADERIPHLLRVPAAMRFLSCEPLLGPVDLMAAVTGLRSNVIAPQFSWLIGRGIGWLICGGESGPNARPMHPDWARSLRDQCAESGVPFLFKQWGSHDQHGTKMDKKAAGRLLDGVLHDGYPETKEAL